jgi:hypothetical protein
VCAGSGKHCSSRAQIAQKSRPRSGDWWLVLICCERKLLLAGWWLVASAKLMGEKSVAGCPRLRRRKRNEIQTWYAIGQEKSERPDQSSRTTQPITLPAVGTLKRYSKTLEYKYRVKTAALDTLKRYSILSLTLYLEWYCTYSILYSGGPHYLNKGKNTITHKPKIQIKFRFHH